MTDFIFLGSKITVDGDCSHEIKIFAPWKKSYDQPRQHIKKQNITFVKRWVESKLWFFSVVMYACDNWTIKTSTEEPILLNCGAGEDSWESFGLQGGQTRQS